ncbi:unnamed protein product, partial [Prorocentrum cordatum]
ACSTATPRRGSWGASSTSAPPTSWEPWTRAASRATRSSLRTRAGRRSGARWRPSCPASWARQAAALPTTTAQRSRRPRRCQTERSSSSWWPPGRTAALRSA